MEAREEGEEGGRGGLPPPLPAVLLAHGSGDERARSEVSLLRPGNEAVCGTSFPYDSEVPTSELASPLLRRTCGPLGIGSRFHG